MFKALTNLRKWYNQRQNMGWGVKWVHKSLDTGYFIKRFLFCIKCRKRIVWFGQSKIYYDITFFYLKWIYQILREKDIFLCPRFLDFIFHASSKLSRFLYRLCIFISVGFRRLVAFSRITGDQAQHADYKKTRKQLILIVRILRCFEVISNIFI